MNTQVLDQSAPSVMRRDIVAPPRTGRIRLSRKQSGIVGGALLAGLGVAWYGNDWWTVGRFIDSTDDAYVGGDVTVIAPKVAGFIAEVAVTDNQEVHAGDLLVRLDDRDYRAALAKAVAGRRRTTGHARQSRCHASSAGGSHRPGAGRTLRNRRRNHARAHDVDRYRSLARRPVGSLQRFQQADADYQKALAADQRRVRRWKPRSVSSM